MNAVKEKARNLTKKEKIAAGVAGGVVLGVAAPFAITGTLAAAGFGSAGVVAGSAAAGIQSYLGSVAAGSLFAMCQSIGAAGLATVTQVGLLAGGTAVGTTVGVVAAASSQEQEDGKYTEKDKDSTNEDDDVSQSGENKVEHDEEELKKTITDQEEESCQEKESDEECGKAHFEDHMKGKVDDEHKAENAIIEHNNAHTDEGHSAPSEGQPPTRYSLISMDNSVINLNPTLFQCSKII